MKQTYTLLLALMVLILAASCGRTVYSNKPYKSNKYIKAKSRYHFWHAHGAKPRAHSGGGGGYW